jgi:hypothetical protein
MLKTPRQLAARFERGEIDCTEFQCKFFPVNLRFCLSAFFTAAFFVAILITGLAI